MNWDVLHRFIETLIWPGIFCALVVLFRGQFVRLLDRISKLSVGDVAVELTEKVESLAAAAKDIESQKEVDDDVVAMVDVQLSETLAPPFDGETLIEAIKGASPRALNSIYRQAKDVRGRAWRSLQTRQAGAFRDEDDKKRALELSKDWMRRTIPVFQGLTELEHRGRWHRYFAQLGYVLKDTGRLEEGLEALEQAIEQWIQQTGSPVSPHYRFNWVYCKVRIDNDQHRDGQPSDLATQAAVRTGLEEGSGFPALADALADDDEVDAWLRRNGLDRGDLNLPQ